MLLHLTLRDITFCCKLFHSSLLLLERTSSITAIKSYARAIILHESNAMNTPVLAIYANTCIECITLTETLPKLKRVEKYGMHFSTETDSRNE